MLLTRRGNAHYQDITCSNGAQVCFIYSDNANKSALSLSIQAGHFNDPDDCPGLAHLFEHMMFASSEIHAKGNDLHALLSKNRGYINAWTSSEHTNFHFDCAPSIFETAAADFVDMLLRPMYSAAGIEQEVAAIDAEFKMRFKDDVRRLYDVHKETVNPAHPFHRFTVGNKQIFEKFSYETLVDMLTRYHREHLCGQSIKICMVIPSFVDVNQRHYFQDKMLALCETFQVKSDLPCLQFPNNAAKFALYPQQFTSKLIRVKPNKRTINAIITFTLPNIDHLDSHKPLLLLAHFLEDSSAGSLTRHLTDQHWISDLTAGGALKGSNYQEFTVNIKLSELGRQHINDVLNHVLSCLKQFKMVPIEHWRICEKASQLALQGQYNDAPPPIDEAVNLSTRLHTETMAYALDSDTEIDIDQESADHALAHVLSFCCVEYMRVFLIDPSLSTQQVTRYYQTPYEVTELNIEHIKNTHVYALSAHNPFMPNVAKQINKLTQSKNLSPLISGNATLWHAFDKRFDTFKSELYVSIEQSSMIGNEVNTAVKKLWLSMVNEFLELEFGQAEFAGLAHKLYGHQGGITLHLSGFSDKQLYFALSIVNKIQQFKASETAFTKAKTKLRNSLQNALLNKPINRLFFEVNCTLQENTYPHHQVLSALDDLSVNTVNTTCANYWHQSYLEILYVGAHSEPDLLDFHRQLIEILPATQRQSKNSKRLLVLSQQTHNSLVAVDSGEHACICYFQPAVPSSINTVSMIMIEKLLSALLFDALRNKRKLGYVVGCGYMPVNNHPGLAVYVQSPEVEAEQLKECITQELSILINATNLSEKRVDDLCKVMQEQFTPEFSNLSQFAQRQWMNLDSELPEKEEWRIHDAFKALDLRTINQALNDLLELENCRLLTLMTEHTNQ